MINIDKYDKRDDNQTTLCIIRLKLVYLKFDLDLIFSMATGVASIGQISFHHPYHTSNC